VSTDDHVSREERRRRTEAAILAGARELFATEGFERTTIRGVAGRAGVDPALVMQYYGSKEGLFAAAARWDSAHETLLTASADQLPTAALDDLLRRMEQDDDSESAVALLRSCLTHPVAARVMKDDVMCDRLRAVRGALDGDDAELRAGVFGAVMIGVAMTRYVMGVEPLCSASPEALRRVVEPVLRALVHPPVAPPPSTDRQAQQPPATA
jgi:AcrR family transcriptional regulator